MKKGKMIAMLLAGGQGARLKLLTQDNAKPALPFGGKYRIIDFPLSNCSNSNIFDVGILTQYKPYILNSHVGIGSAWDLDRPNGGVRLLPPYMSETRGHWYKGTANAIYENMNFIDGLDPEYVLILSGDHIYKMDYSEMLDFHKKRGADITISVIEVPWEETSRFGIVNTGENDIIEEFEEKPKKAKSNLASMGIYIFNWNSLREYLIKDEADETSGNDFGHDIIPAMKRDGLQCYAYRFDGYWKDVGTIKSYWEAHMDLLDEHNTLNLYDRRWKIYTKNRHQPPHFIGGEGKVVNSLVNEGCRIYGSVSGSVLGSEIVVEDGAEVIDSVILNRARIKKGAKIVNSVVMHDVVIEESKKIGEVGSEDVYLVSQNEMIKSE